MNFMMKAVTMRFVALMGEPSDYMSRLDGTANATDKRRIYEEILGLLNDAGYKGNNSKQLEIKWKNLQSKFRKERQKCSGDNAPGVRPPGPTIVQWRMLSEHEQSSKD